MRHWMRAAAVLALVMALGACGGDDDSDDSASGPEDFCAYATQIDESDALGADLSEEAAAEDPSALESQLADTLDAMEGLVDRAPSEIEGDLEVVQQYFQDFDSVLAKYDYDLVKLGSEGADDPDAQALFTGDQSEVEAASAAVEEYLTTTCGISLED